MGLGFKTLVVAESIHPLEYYLEESRVANK
jgi:hypothetical protein